jgi:hypothetical protein
MIRVTDYRIGNIILQGGNITIIDSLERSINDWERTNHKRTMDTEPIEFTEEWIVKFGLSKQNGYPYKYLNGFLKIRNGVFFFKYHDLEVELPFVHNFQNLNFALTGVELSVS